MAICASRAKFVANAIFWTTDVHDIVLMHIRKTAEKRKIVFFTKTSFFRILNGGMILGLRRDALYSTTFTSNAQLQNNAGILGLGLVLTSLLGGSRAM